MADFQHAFLSTSGPEGSLRRSGWSLGFHEGYLRFARGVLGGPFGNLGGPAHEACALEFLKISQGLLGHNVALAKPRACFQRGP